MHKFRLICISLCFFLALGTAVTAAHVELIVSVPETTGHDDKVCITGNLLQLSNWDGAGIPLRKTGPHQYVFQAYFAEGSELEFKFTRGSFASVEKTHKGHERPNRRLKVEKSNISQSLTVEAWADKIVAPDQKPNITGNYKILRQVESKFLQPARDVVVWLPPSYTHKESTDKRYPVIYMHDGNNLFDPGTSFGGVDWGVDEAMSAGIKTGALREAIIVGISNTIDRMSEYTPFSDPKHKGGDGENYARFIVEELKPMIDKEFRTMPDSQNTFVGGSSLGGLISLYIGISRPQTFGGIIAVSPSIWWSNGGIIDWLISNNIENYPGKIWVDMGTREGEQAIEFARLLASEIAARASAFKGLTYREFPGGTHSESAWSKRIHMVLGNFIGQKSENTH